MSEMLYQELFGDSTNEMTNEKILSNLLSSEKDLGMKTHILAPFEVTMLETLADYYKKRKLKMLSKFIESWISKYKTNMVSWKRLSRQETTAVLSARMEDKTTTLSTFKKLFGQKE